MRSIPAVTTRPREWRTAARPAASSHSRRITPPCTFPAVFASVTPIQRVRIEADSEGVRGSTRANSMGRDVSRPLARLQPTCRHPMDHSRYLAYRAATRSLDRMAEWRLDHHERERIRDTAEALLLTNDAEEAERLRRDAA